MGRGTEYVFSSHGKVIYDIVRRLNIWREREGGIHGGSSGTMAKATSLQGLGKTGGVMNFEQDKKQSKEKQN